MAAGPIGRPWALSFEGVRAIPDDSKAIEHRWDRPFLSLELTFCGTDSPEYRNFYEGFELITNRMRLDVSVPVVHSRYVVVHYHIFKNGGTTLESILEREFADRFATLHGHGTDAVLDSEDLLEFLQQHPGVSAISSHHLRYPKPYSRRMVFFDCCFLRNPLSRLHSCYNHFRRSNSDDLYSRWARSYTPREFLTRLIDEAPQQVSEVQVTQLASAGVFVRPADERDLERATAAMRDMAFPGVVEMFDESLVVAEHYLRPAFPALRLEYVRQNVSRPGGRPPAESREHWESLWGKDLYQRLLRMNELDIELVRRAKGEILRRLDGVPRASQKLADLQWRCARLAAASGGRMAPVLVPAAEEEERPRRMASGD